MSDLSRRPYHSPRREEAARETQRVVLEAARQQFVLHGYAGTSLAAIARAAGVSLATVKLVGGTKAQLLIAAIRAVIRREDPTVELVEQGWWREMLAEGDSDGLLRRFASRIRSALERQADLFEVVWQAAASEPEIGALEQRASLSRWEDVRQVGQGLADLGVLRPGLDVDGAADVIWALASPQVYRLLVARRGWTPERWEAWLLDSLRGQLLAGPGESPASG